MTILVAVTDDAEGAAALAAAGTEAAELHLGLVAVNLTSADLDTTALDPDVTVEVVTPTLSQRDEIEEVLGVLADHPDVTKIFVGVRRRSPVGKAILGSIAQQLILEAPRPVVAVKASYEL